jgi:acetylglutamate kinase
LVEKLNKPIGTEGHIFRDTAVENVIDGLKRAKMLNINADSDIDNMADTLMASIKMYENNKDVLRQSPVVREQAAKKLDEIAKKMAMFGMTP